MKNIFNFHETQMNIISNSIMGDREEETKEVRDEYDDRLDDHNPFLKD